MSDSMIPIPIVDPLDLAWLECNDTGNAERLEALSGGLLKWVDDKFWVAFDGRRWSEREGGFRARTLAREVGKHLNEEAAALGELIGDPERPDREALARRYPGAWCTPDRAIERLKALRAWAVRSGNATQANAMLTQAKDLPGMRAWTENFDKDPLAFNVENGTLFFREDADGRWRCDFRPGHEPGDMIRQIAGCVFDATAICPQWVARFELVQPDPEQRAILPILYGQSLTGLTDGEEFYTHQGLGGDGKSKTHEVLAPVFGDYYRHAGVKTWLSASFQKSGSEHRSDLVRLAGDIRFVVSEEPPRNAMWDSELMKQVTGGGNVTARGSGATTEITYKPRFKVHAECNKLPAPPSDDRGWWRRQYILPWPVDTSTLQGGTEAPAKLIARLLEERAGILNWLIDGCLKWLELRKVPRPERVEAAISSARSGTSPIAEWLAEACDLSDRSIRESATELYTAFKSWCEGQQLDKVPSQRRFGDALTDRQIYVDRDRTGRKIRCGIRLRGSNPLIEEEGVSRAAEATPEPPKAVGREITPDPYEDDPLGG